uniref:Uncharacterized protein n=1 Tax=Oryza brachyantha TaxID=4533 RepID=J3LXF2_ORYBR
MAMGARRAEVKERRRRCEWKEREKLSLGLSRTLAVAKLRCEGDGEAPRVLGSSSLEVGGQWRCEGCVVAHQRCGAGKQPIRQAVVVARSSVRAPPLRVLAQNGGCVFWRWYDPETTPYLRQVLNDLHDVIRDLKEENLEMRASILSARAQIDDRTAQTESILFSASWELP